MSEKLDAIIFGATGFTGKIVIQDAVEILKDFKWGIAGRNNDKLEAVLKEVSSKVGKDLKDVPIILADVNDILSIEEMASKCKVVLNCCGPYRFHGETVVKACIEAGTHHVDISGEPQYADSMYLKYNNLAAEKGAYVVSTCAFGSIPSEMGVVYMERNFPGTVNSVEMFWENSVDYTDKGTKALLHYGTWESAVYAMNNARKVLTLQKKVFANLKQPKLKPKLRVKPLQKPSTLSSYFLPFASDRDVVERSQRRLFELEQKRPVQFESYVGFRCLLRALWLPFQALMIAILAQCSCTLNLLLKYPNFFSSGILTHDGPTEAHMNAHCFSMTFRAKGWSKGQDLLTKPSQELLARISGSNPFYGFTSVAVLCAAKTILKESDKMPRTGGVFTPGAAFAKTSLIEELGQHKRGLQFEILNQAH